MSTLDPAVREQREEKRNLFTVTVEYSVTSDGPESDCSRGVGLTTNISKSGLGLILNCPLEKGQRLALSGDRLSDGLLTANVRWCCMISTGIYRIGLRLN